MKCVPVITAILLLGSGSVMAQEEYKEDNSNQLLGAIAGGYLGSSVGDGDGRRAATVIGAILGWRYGNELLGENNYAYQQEFRSYRNNHFYRYCNNIVPPNYSRNEGVRRSWISGCVQRLTIEQQQLEQQAYEAGRDLNDR